MKLDRSLHKRLADLERGLRPDPPAPGAPAAPAAARGLLSVGEAEERHGALEDLLPGLPRAAEHGQYWELITPLHHYGDWAVEAVGRWVAAAGEGRFPGQLLPAGAAPAGNPPGLAAVFFDTETTGLNNEPLFLVGMLCHDGREGYIRQLLARDYTEEPAVLAEARSLLTAAGLVVSYNGVRFDVPYLQGRLRYHRLGSFHPGVHLDLLPVARRVLGRSLGDCKLQTLERHLCRRERNNDIPGAQIPQAYHDFVADGDAGRLRRIVEHNSFDVVTLAELAGHLAMGRPSGGT